MNTFVEGTNNSFWIKTCDFKAAIIALFVCVFFFTPGENWPVFSLVTKWNMFSSSSFVCREYFHCSDTQHWTNFALPSTLIKNKTNKPKKTDAGTWLIYSSIWNTAYHTTLTMTITFICICLVYHLWFGTESQVEWTMLLSFKRLLAVLWHMYNPTRNQSLCSYWGNRWANMFPGGCPYYSGASGPPGDSRARWNWGVVTTEWTGNELLRDKWVATREIKDPPTKSRNRRWMAASTDTALPWLYYNVISV